MNKSNRIVERVQFPNKPTIKLLRTAAYARVSSGKDAMLHSLSAQVSYYNSLIQSNPEWLFCGVYADEALTGTKDNRENFQRLLTECRAGNIDLIITKSISRFARKQSKSKIKFMFLDICGFNHILGTQLQCYNRSLRNSDVDILL